MSDWKFTTAFVPIEDAGPVDPREVQRVAKDIGLQMEHAARNMERNIFGLPALPWLGDPSAPVIDTTVVKEEPKQIEGGATKQ